MRQNCDFASLVPVYTVDGAPIAGVHRGGRPTSWHIPQEILRSIREYHAEHGKAPSLNWVYTVTRLSLGKGYNRIRAARAIEEALYPGEEEKR